MCREFGNIIFKPFAITAKISSLKKTNKIYSNYLDLSFIRNKQNIQKITLNIQEVNSGDNQGRPVIITAKSDRFELSV